jgi:CheY-like chemotaxis protein
MPRKDGYQACREVRAWEAVQRAQRAERQQQAQQQNTQGGDGNSDDPANDGADAPLPIIALSANVMSDVHDKCVEAGFNDYVTKPVDFIDLSRVLAKFF